MNRLRPAARLILAVLFAGAGVLHLVSPEPFLQITPDWVPFADLVIRWTGVAEIAGAIGLLIPRTRVAAGWALAAYAVAVFPANVKHALEGVEVAGLPTGWWYHGPRLALQPVIVLWCLWASGASDRLRRR
jgi:uncharacterized membrane protein